MGDTSIEWTNKTWNPIRGCTRVSKGCERCYAEREANRHKGPGDAYEGLVQIANGHPQWTGKIRFVEEHLEDPLHWRDPRLVFVNSMSDLFHDGVTEDWLDRIFAVMALAQDHTFQVLTKRPARMLEYCSRLQQREVAVSLAITRNPWWDGPQASPCAVGTIEDRIAAGPLPNVWLGVSCENQATADERIPLLLQTPAAVRWLSLEPLLGPITFRPQCESLADKLHAMEHGYASKPMELVGIDWVVVGGESGPGARMFELEWARSIRDQCKAAGVPFFMKQMGSNCSFRDGSPRTGPEKYPVETEEQVAIAADALGEELKHWFRFSGKGGDIKEFPPDLRIREYPKTGGNSAQEGR